MFHYPHYRSRRLRMNQVLRDFVSDVSLQLQHFVQPVFISEKILSPVAIKSMPGIFQYDLNSLEKEITVLYNLGIRQLIFFGIPSEKDQKGSAALLENGIVQKAIRLSKKVCPEMLVIADCCFCEYTAHGHCGMLDAHNCYVENDESITALGKQALSLAQAGADIIAPSAAMDGMVAAIRHALDNAQFTTLPIMSYSMKYASNLYGPFREAAEGSPEFGDRKTYQADYRRSNEVFPESVADLHEGSDFLMVKPAGFYLDVISRIKAAYPGVPLAAYQVSGEYSMLQSAIQTALLDEKIIMESLFAIKRAGADIIISYFTKYLAEQGLLD